MHCIGLSNGFGRKLNLCLFPLYLSCVRLIVQCFCNCQDLERLYCLPSSEFCFFSTFLYITGDSHSSGQDADRGVVVELQIHLMCPVHMLETFADLINFPARYLNSFQPFSEGAGTLPPRITWEFCLTNSLLMQRFTTMTALKLCLTSSNAALQWWHTMGLKFVSVVGSILQTLN